MKATHRLIAILAFWLALPIQGQSQGIKDRLQETIRHSKFNGSVLVSHEGNVLLSAGYGFANHQERLANTQSTQHRIGSITKQFTAMAILMLEEQGKLDTQAEVGSYLKSVPNTWKKLTIHQLLTHTSGLTHSWSVPAFARNGSKPRSLDETLKLFYDLPLKFEPGTSFQYSGVGYFLLAKIIESQSNQSYAAFLQEHVFKPLGMKNTGCDQPDHRPDKASTGYRVNPRGDRRLAPRFYMPLLTGGGNLYSTVEDMNRWDQALTEHKLISKESYHRMYQTERRNYAYGWTVRKQGGERWIHHGGGVPGHRSFFLRNPARNLCVILMSNHQTKGGQLSAFRLAKMVLDAIDQE